MNEVVALLIIYTVASESLLYLVNYFIVKTHHIFQIIIK
jgi:hypothetical protein